MTSPTICAIIFDWFGVLYQDDLDRDLIPLVRGLRRHYRIGLLSNAGRDILDRLLRTNQAQELFDVVVASSETGYLKPQREIFELTAQRLGASFSELIFVDDSASHVAAASSYGIAAIHYQNLPQLKAALHQFDIPAL